MQSKIILFPAGGIEARKHYESSVKRVIKLKEFSDYLDSDSLNKIYYGDDVNKCQIALWGLVPTKRLNQIYKRIEPNDIVMFVQGGEIISFAMVLMKLESPILSEKYWGSNEWSNVIFLTSVKSKNNISLQDICKYLGYKENYILRGPLLLDNSKSNDILSKDEGLRGALEEWISAARSKMKKEEGSKDVLNFNPKIFISYSHKDEKYKDELKNHLMILFNIWKAGQIWDDRDLDAGTDYNIQIDREMEEANIHIILISSDYFASNACMSELEKMLKMDRIIIPIIVRDCYWEKLFSSLEKSIITFPENKANIFASMDKDNEYKKIVEYIDKNIDNIVKNNSM